LKDIYKVNNSSTISSNLFPIINVKNPTEQPNNSIVIDFECGDGEIRHLFAIVGAMRQRIATTLHRTGHLGGNVVIKFSNTEDIEWRSLGDPSIDELGVGIIRADIALHGECDLGTKVVEESLKTEITDLLASFNLKHKGVNVCGGHMGK